MMFFAEKITQHCNFLEHFVVSYSDSHTAGKCFHTADMYYPLAVIQCLIKPRVSTLTHSRAVSYYSTIYDSTMLTAIDIMWDVT